MATEQNTALDALLHEAGWTPRVLAAELNTSFGQGTVSPTAPYHWRDRGAVPRPPLPAMTAAVFSRRLNRPTTASMIWEGYRDTDAGLIELASQGLEGPWDRGGAVSAVTWWTDAAGLRRRDYLQVSGAVLLRAVWAWLDKHSAPAQGTSPPPLTTAGGPLLEHIELSIPVLQRLDDAHGGAAHLAYVESQLRGIGLVLREGRHTQAVERRLLAAAATVGQLCGWMALDAGAQGAAQRHWFTALRAAHAIGDRPLAGHILADLSFQSASGPDARDALVLAEAAAEITARSPATVRASIASRLAYAYAAAGRRAEFERTRTWATDLLGQRQDAREPEWMYYLTPSHLDCQAGYSLVALGRRQLSFGDREGRREVNRGIGLLRTGAFDVPTGDPSARRALYEGAWLALGHAGLGDYQEACTVAALATSRLTEVHSPRSNQVLGHLVADLRKRRKSPVVRDALPGIEHALQRAER